MKNIEKMTELEILALTDSQAENLVKVEKMERGIKLLEKPVEPEYEIVPEKDKHFYYVEGFDSFVFSDQENAVKLSEMLKDHTKKAYWKKYSSYPQKQEAMDNYYKNRFDFNVLKISYFSPETYEIGKSIESRNKILSERYQKAYNEYEKYSEDVESVVSSVWDKVRNVRNKYENLRSLRNKLSEYNNLAENKKDALTFFLKAYSVTDDELQLIQSGNLGDKKE